MKNIPKPKIPNSEVKANSPNTIWYPEWRDFKIVEKNEVFLLYGENELLFQSRSIDSIKYELMERHYFYYKQFETPKEK
jgi:predicted SAM-dependent methyltransferase